MSGVDALRRRARSPSSKALAGTLLGNGFGFVFPFALSAVFGISALTDAYFLAFAAATFVSSIANVAIESNTLTSAHDARRIGRAAVLRFTAITALRAALIAIVVYGVVAFVVELVTPEPSAAQQHVLDGSLAWFGVFVAVTSAASVVNGALFAHQQFFMPPATSGLRAIAALGALAVLPVVPASLPWLAAAWAGGEVLRLVALWATLWRVAAVNDDGAGDGTIRSPWPPLFHHAVSLCVVGGVPLIDRAFAQHLGDGAVTILELGEKVMYVPTLVFNSSILVVVGSRWAEAVSAGRDPRADARRVFRQLGVLSGAVAFMFIAGAVGVAVNVDELFGADSWLLAGVVCALCVGLPASILVNASSRFLTATGRTGALPAFAAFSLIGNTVLDAVGAAAFGLVGIALATTATRTVSVVFYIRHVFGVAPRLGTKPDGENPQEAIAEAAAAGDAVGDIAVDEAFVVERAEA